MADVGGRSFAAAINLAVDDDASTDAGAGLDEEEILRTIAVFRFILPDADIRLAGGRSLLSDRGERAFRSGANAAITGDMLTTAGLGTKSDIELVKSLGYTVCQNNM